MTFRKWLASVTRLSSDFNAQLQPLRAKILSDPYCRFHSTEEIRLAAVMGIRIDVNQASVDDWLRLPGLSIHQARSLVDLTQGGVQFHCLEDLAAALNLPVQRLKPLEPVLSFYYYDAESICSIQQLNPNTASTEMLIRIPVVDLFLARAIVQNRLLAGPYRNLADLQRRLALPGSLTAELMHYLCF